MLPTSFRKRVTHISCEAFRLHNLHGCPDMHDRSRSTRPPQRDRDRQNSQLTPMLGNRPMLSFGFGARSRVSHAIWEMFFRAVAF